MKKKLFIHILSSVLFIVILSSFQKVIIYEGVWVDKKTESKNLIIEKNGNTFLIKTNNNRTYEGKLVDNVLEINRETSNIRVIITVNDELLIGGETYIRQENTFNNKITGKWKILDGQNIVVKIDYLGNEAFRITDLSSVSSTDIIQFYNIQKKYENEFWHKKVLSFQYKNKNEEGQGLFFLDGKEANCSMRSDAEIIRDREDKREADIKQQEDLKKGINGGSTIGNPSATGMVRLKD